MKNNRYRDFIALLTIGLAVLAGLYQLSRAREYQLFGELVARVETAVGVVALTFDDGPTPRQTQDVIDMLDDLDVVATFYLNGAPAAQNAEQVRALALAGHELGNHAWHHDRMVLMSPARVRREIEDTDAAIRAAGYDGPLTFRPPYGKKLFVLPWVLADMGRTAVTWDVEPESAVADDAGAQEIADHVIANAHSGSIVLLHVMYDHGGASRDAVPMIVEGLRARGMAFVTVSEMLALRKEAM